MTCLAAFPCSLPTAPIPEDIDATAVASEFQSELDHTTAENFTEDAVWKDVYALTGTLRSFFSSSSIAQALKKTSERAQVHSFILDPKSVRVSRLPGGTSWVEARYSFETTASPPTICSAIISLTPVDGGKWKIWTMRTILEQLKSQPNVDELQPAGDTEVTNGHLEVTHFDCVVVGGGQAGLSMAGRAKAMRLSCVVLDRYQRVGDSWASRYDSARLHTTREYAHLPFNRTFPDTYQEWLTKDDLARGYQDWVKEYGIDVWLATKPTKGTWDSEKSLWTLEIDQQGKSRVITSSNIVLAGGGGGQEPVKPEYPGEDVFQGDILHSVHYRNAAKWKGKHGIVLGTANTGHDVANDMLEAGCASVTMIQRNRTYVVPQSHYKKTADDRAFITQPYPISDLISQKVLHSMAATEPERYKALERAGFKVDPYGSLVFHLQDRLGGHYMDVGVSAKIADGSIKVKSDAVPTKYTQTGLLFSDGKELPCDAIVFATGFKGNMRYLAQEIFGDEVAEQMGDFWGLDKYGEIKGAFKPCGHPALWYHGGSIGQARYMSRFIAMSIKARMIGTPLTICDKTF